ncbi:MAG: DUF1553 domain-containing protein [Planctomycetaceae bacterium]|nr:DUF1553 domain-containing protein [Planctomycetaceae bacterium]
MKTLQYTILTMLLLSTTSYISAAELTELRVFPPEISLKTSKDRQSVVVQAVYADGITQDVTETAQWSLADGSFAALEGNLVKPLADGQTQLSVAFEGQTATVPVLVKEAMAPRPVSFKLDVMPIFMKSGCNSGSCHGAASGKDGFELSLFGYDPDGDHQRITRELPGRRIDLAVPEASLIVQKSVGAVPHTGGKLFDLDSPMAKDLIEWIASGTPADPADLPVCTELELYPKQAVLSGEGTTQRITVLARYSDGSTRDVTSLALTSSNNAVSAEISPEGIVTAGARGEAFIMARYYTHTVVSQYIVLPAGLEYEERPVEPVNYVDELVADKLRKLRIHPSELCDDATFLRRITIDLTGLVPTQEEYDSFMADQAPNKRELIIDELLQRREFTEILVSKWAELLMMRSSNQVPYKAVVLYYQWLADQIANDVPMDEMVKALLSSDGGTFDTPATNFYQIERDSLKVAENVAQIFMGMRIQCAQCHNHPFDRWTQDDYYSFAAFFSQVGRKGTEDYRQQIVFNGGGGEVKHPVTGQNAVPVFLGGAQPDTAGKDRRKVLAEWLASPENPYFARNFANRLWAHFFGIGIIEPVDDVRVSNPASNPELLDALAQHLTESGYDIRQLVREICNSKTYQRSTIRNDSNMSDEMNFAHQNIRRIKAESMLDIVSQVTNTKDKFRGLPLGAKATQIADGTTSSYFLTTFGRATRETVCSCEVKMEPTLSQALHLMNGDTVNAKMKQGGVLKALQDEGLEPMQIVDRLYVACLARKPTEEEVASLSPLFAEGSDINQGLEDSFWALLNSREFLFNH